MKTKRLFLSGLLASALCQSVMAQSLPSVPITVSDITTLIDDYLSPDNKGRITVEDITKLIDEYLLQGMFFCPDFNHPHAIDLGLPSGTKWACCNIGASCPDEYGGYYAWGETEEKSYYVLDTYKYYNSSTGWVNIGSDIAGTSYDVAHVKWGGSWRMPTIKQQRELLNECSSEWTTENGVYGRRFIGLNGASVFLPAAGYRIYGDLYFVGDHGLYWSSWLDSPGYKYAYDLVFHSYDADWSGHSCSCGLSVRAVCP